MITTKTLLTQDVQYRYTSIKYPDIVYQVSMYYLLNMFLTI